MLGLCQSVLLRRNPHIHKTLIEPCYGVPLVWSNHKAVNGVFAD